MANRPKKPAPEAEPPEAEPPEAEPPPPPRRRSARDDEPMAPLFDLPHHEPIELARIAFIGVYRIVEAKTGTSGGERRTYLGKVEPTATLDEVRDAFGGGVFDFVAHDAATKRIMAGHRLGIDGPPMGHQQAMASVNATPLAETPSGMLAATGMPPHMSMLWAVLQQSAQQAREDSRRQVETMARVLEARAAAPGAAPDHEATKILQSDNARLRSKVEALEDKLSELREERDKLKFKLLEQEHKKGKWQDRLAAAVDEHGEEVLGLIDRTLDKFLGEGSAAPRGPAERAALPTPAAPST